MAFNILKHQALSIQTASGNFCQIKKDQTRVFSHLKMKIIAGIYSFKNLKNGLLYVKQKKSSEKATPHFINDVFLNDFEIKLKELLQRIKSSNFLPYPHTKKCYWCEDIAS